MCEGDFLPSVPVIQQLPRGLSAMKGKSADAQGKGVQPALGFLKKFQMDLTGYFGGTRAVFEGGWQCGVGEGPWQEIRLVGSGNLSHSRLYSSDLEWCTA